MTYRAREAMVPDTVSVDSLWAGEPGRPPLCLRHLGWHDRIKLISDGHTRPVTDQLCGRCVPPLRLCPGVLDRSQTEAVPSNARRVGPTQEPGLERQARTHPEGRRYRTPMAASDQTHPSADGRSPSTAGSYPARKGHPVPSSPRHSRTEPSVDRRPSPRPLTLSLTPYAFRFTSYASNSRSPTPWVSSSTA